MLLKPRPLLQILNLSPSQPCFRPSFIFRNCFVIQFPFQFYNSCLKFIVFGLFKCKALHAVTHPWKNRYGAGVHMGNNPNQVEEGETPVVQELSSLWHLPKLQPESMLARLKEGVADKRLLPVLVLSR